jgi:hypothetical protein
MQPGTGLALLRCRRHRRHRFGRELFGLTRGELAYVLDTFPIVEKRDRKAHGEYRTKRITLEFYDAMAEAASTDTPDQSRAERPPANPAVDHPDPENGRAVDSRGGLSLSVANEVPAGGTH